MALAKQSKSCLRCGGDRIVRSEYETGDELFGTRVAIGTKKALFGTATREFQHCYLLVCCDCGTCEFKLSRDYLEKLWQHHNEQK